MLHFPENNFAGHKERAAGCIGCPPQYRRVHHETRQEEEDQESLKS
jgi:hypothetical protein